MTPCAHGIPLYLCLVCSGNNTIPKTPLSNKWDIRFLQLAKLVSTWSKDPSTQTGAAIIRPDRTVLSVGFNGFPKGMMDKAEFYQDREEKYSRIVHCEVNALVHTKESVKGCVLYTWPFLSCDRCCVQMLQAGITKFVAPVPSNDTLSRWGKAFDKTKQYCKEIGAEVVEIPMANIFEKP